jgi:endonuclease/exonuclease/phosphatase (EEP) superfamily protein YafD
MSEFLQMKIRGGGLLRAAGFMILAGGVASFFGSLAWWLEIFSHFRIQYIVVFAVLTLGCALFRQWKWAAAFSLLLLFNAIPVVSFVLPLQPFDDGTSPALKMALMNVNSVRGDPDQVLAFLQKENPDLILLEEITPEWMQRLAPVLDEYPNQQVNTRNDNFGMGLFSRVEPTVARLKYWGSAGVPSIVASMEVDGHPFTLMATHPLPPAGAVYSRLRNEQLMEVADFAATIQGPLILIGDLNCSPWSPQYRRFIDRCGLLNSSEGRRIYPTWPSFIPWLQIPIDHCLYDDGIVIRSKIVGKSIGSDHLPLLVEFSLK